MWNPIPLNDSDGEELFPDVPPNADSHCIFCNLCFNRNSSSKKWVQCLQCDIIWAHEECLPKNQAIFLCESCLNA